MYGMTVMHTTDSFFARVDYREFKRRLNRCPQPDIRRKAYETVIYDEEGDVLGIVHAASIDEKGRCHPTEYYLRRIDPPGASPRLVA
jgi:hypothetical protein